MAIAVMARWWLNCFPRAELALFFPAGSFSTWLASRKPAEQSKQNRTELLLPAKGTDTHTSTHTYTQSEYALMSSHGSGTLSHPADSRQSAYWTRLSTVTYSDQVYNTVLRYYRGHQFIWRVDLWLIAFRRQAAFSQSIILAYYNLVFHCYQ